MEIDLVLNCFERTYRDLLAEGRIRGITDSNQVDFPTVTLLINNVNDPQDARRRAKAALARGEITRVVEVAERLPEALKRCGLKPKHIRRLPHYTDCCLVAVTLDGPDLMVYWDADAQLDEPADWITPVAGYMEAHPEIGVGNPAWWHEGEPEREALRIDGDFAIGYGFSDVVFMVRRSEFARPIYRYISPASWRYPLAPVEAIFEQRADAYMRRKRRLRATYLPVVYRHTGAVGGGYPDVGLRERARKKVRSLLPGF